MRYLYYCNSAYQILSVLNLHWQRKNAGYEDIKDYAADLIVLNSFTKAEEIAKLVEDSSLFDHVWLVGKAYNSGRFHALKTLADFLFPSFYLKDKYGFRKKDIAGRYAAICVPKYSTITAAIWRLNPQADIHIMEDGAGAYFGSFRLDPDSRLYRKFFKTFNRGRDFHDYSAIYLNKGALYTGKQTDKVRDIPDYDEGFLKQVRTIFRDYCDVSDLKGHDIYYFAQFLNNKDINVFIDSLLEKMEKYKDKVVYIPHPRHKDAKTYPFDYASERQIWEIRQADIEDLDEKLLISIHSTACFTPKILFDKEPYVLLFYDLCDDVVTTRNGRFDEFVERFKKTYSDPGKVMIPSSEEEFLSCIEAFYRKLG